VYSSHNARKKSFLILPISHKGVIYSKKNQFFKIQQTNNIVFEQNKKVDKKSHTKTIKYNHINTRILPKKANR